MSGTLIPEPMSAPRVGSSEKASTRPPPLRLAPRRAARRRVGRAVAVAAAVMIVAGIGYTMLPDPVPVEFAAVIRGPMEGTISEDGRTRVRDRYELAAPVAGLLRRVAIEVGDSVRRGQIVARLVPLTPPLLDARATVETRSRVAAAEAALAQARSTVDRAADASAVAAREADRLHALFTAGAVSLQTVETGDLVGRTRAEELAAARSGVEVAAAELATRRAGLARLTGGGPAVALRAPVDGVVLAVPRESEGPVAAGQPLLVFGDPRDLEVEVDLLTADAAAVRPGAGVRIERWGGTAPLGGHVVRIDPAAFTKLSALGVEEQRVNVVVAFDDPYDQWRSLGDGYRVEARVVVWSIADAVQVPASAIFRRGDDWLAFRVEDDRAREVRVTIGRRTDTAAEVVQGLAPGDAVVVYPGEQVRDGARVRAR